LEIKTYKAYGVQVAEKDSGYVYQITYGERVLMTAEIAVDSPGDAKDAGLVKLRQLLETGELDELYFPEVHKHYRSPA